jgi:hypothetical protein
MNFAHQSAAVPWGECLPLMGYGIYLFVRINQLDNIPDPRYSNNRFRSIYVMQDLTKKMWDTYDWESFGK